jgi:type IV pilus assembly protein PilA
MKNGFTLVEIIIVIVIIGILASVGLTQYAKAVEKERAAEARMILGTLRSAEVSDYMDTGGYVALNSLGVSAPTACVTTHFFSYACNAGTGTCTATRCTAGGKTPDFNGGGFGCGPGVTYTKTLDVNGNFGGTAGY